MILKKSNLIFAAFLLSFSIYAFGAKVALISSDDATILEGPQDVSKVLGAAKKGEVVSISNSIKDGYYKVRTKSGLVGYIREGFVTIKDPNEAVSEEPAEPPKKKKKYDKDEYSDDEYSTDAYKGDARKFRIRGLLGLSFFNPKILNDAMGVNSVKPGIGYGLELGFVPVPALGFLIHAERFSKSLTVSDSAGNPALETTYSSMPIMGGLEVRLIHASYIEFYVAGFYGIALSTQANVVGNAGEIDWSSNAPTFLGRGSLHFMFSESVAMFAESGYRSLKTVSMQQPSSDTLGGTTFTSGGTYIPIILDYSGIFINLGISFKL